jgi:hypothetical protein
MYVVCFGMARPPCTRSYRPILPLGGSDRGRRSGCVRSPPAPAGEGDRRAQLDPPGRGPRADRAGELGGTGARRFGTARGSDPRELPDEPSEKRYAAGASLLALSAAPSARGRADSPGSVLARSAWVALRARSLCRPTTSHAPVLWVRTVRLALCALMNRRAYTAASATSLSRCSKNASASATHAEGIRAPGNGRSSSDRRELRRRAYVEGMELSKPRGELPPS